MLQETIREVNRLQPTKPVWLEYVLLSGVNDSSEDQRALLEFCTGLNVEVNLIPYNSVADNPDFQSTSRNEREAFATVLRRAGVRTTIRTSFGSNQAAACGQLAGSAQA